MPKKSNDEVRDECSGAPHWPVGCDSLTGQGVFKYVGNMQDEYAVGLLAGAVDSTLEVHRDSKRILFPL